ncbi:MAG: hypothetical protein ABUS47_08195 [Steroidobacter sp.]
MTPKSTIQEYINNFRRRLTPFLRPGIGLTCIIHGADVGGAILEFTFSSQAENDDIYKPSLPTLGKALSGIEQRAFGGNLDAFNFGGTNYVLEANKIILIKDGSSSEWDDAAAARDVNKILRPPGSRMPK